MAPDATENIKYYLSLDETYRPNLAAIRLWPSLKAGVEDKLIWIKELTYAQIHSLEVQQLPSKRVFYENQGRLFPLNSLLPERTVPSLLWTPVERLLPVTLPSFNHNFFGIDQTLSLQIVPSQNEKPATALLVYLSDLEDYLKTCAEIRLQGLQWCLLNQLQVLLIGTPLLPIPGAVYWQRGQFLLSAGFDFDLHLLADALQARLNADNTCWIFWNLDQTCSLVPKADCVPLTLSSFHSTQQMKIS